MKSKPTLVKIMRLTFLQLLIGLFVISNALAENGNAQSLLDKKVSINETNTELRVILKKIEIEHSCNFVYSPQLIDAKQKTSVFFQQRPLKEILDNLLPPLNLTYEVSGDVVVVKKTVSSMNTGSKNIERAEKNISGKVVDQKTGESLPGVTVRLKGTTTAVTTDENGLYTISVPDAQAILEFNYIGYEAKELLVGSNEILNVVLKPQEQKLDEVVVVGYGTQKQSQVSGAISSIKASDLKNQQVTRFDEALQGRVSGVNVVQSSGAPGSSPTIRVRGTSSINSSDPLYVIDGVVVDNGGLDNINPNDIASIDVLKDASAAIYGSRASSGVVIVTTKKGNKGAPSLTYDGFYGIQSAIKKVELTNASQYASLRNQAIVNDGGTPLFANPQGLGEGTNWQDVIFGKNVPLQNHTISLSGATDKATYYTSFGYVGQQGIITPSIAHYKRGNFTINSTYSVNKWLTIGENLSLSYTRSQTSLNTNTLGGNGPLSSALALDPLTPLVVNNIDAQPNAGIYRNPLYAPYLLYDDSGLPYGISNYVLGEASNPLAYQKIQQGYNWGTNILGSAFVELKPIPGLTIRSQVSTKAGFYGNNSFTPLFFLSVTANNLITPTQNIATNKNFTINWDNTITYARAFGQHNFKMLAGSNIQSESGNGLSGSFIGAPVNSLNEASPNFALPDVNKIAGGYDLQPYRLSSLFTRLTYDYDQKYLFNLTIRRDGSSKFGPNNRFGTFPSAEVGYIVSRENFFPKEGFVNFLKFRGSYGVLGNELSLGLFQYAATIGSGRNTVFGNSEVAIGYSPNGLTNPDLKWEEVKIANLGIDAVIFKNLNISLDLYQKKTDGILTQVQLPSYVGTSTNPFANIGNMENKGVEFSMSYSRKFGNLSINGGGNISYNHNKVTNLGNQIRYITYGNIAGSIYEIQRSAVGESFRQFYGFQNLGVFHSQSEIDSYISSAGNRVQPDAKPGDLKWADLNNDGKINADDRKFLGNSIAPYTYGVNLNLTYLQFDFKVFGQGVWGNKIAQNYRRLDYPQSNYQIAALDAWTASNPNGNYPRLTDNDPNNNLKNFSDFYLQSGAYFRIKTIQLGYTLPSLIAGKAGLKNARLYLSGNNVFTITKYTGYDPEISGGIDGGIYPQAKTFIVGLNLAL